MNTSICQSRILCSPDQQKQLRVSNRFINIFIGIWAAIGVISLFLWRNLTIDDAFIGWRHGYNLVFFGQYSANPSGERVEAATSLIYGMLATFPAVTGVDVVLFFKITSIVIMLAQAITIFLLPLSRRHQVILLLVALGGPVQAIHAWSGMETPLFICLASWVCFYSVGLLRSPGWVAGSVASILVLTRPEGIVFVAASLSCAGWSSGLGRSWHLRNAFRVKAIWIPSLAIFLVSAMWRLFYFGAAIPNSAATKLTSENLGTLIGTISSNAHVLAPLVVALPTVALLLDRSTRRVWVVLCLVIALPTVIAYLPTTLAMNFAQRFTFEMFWPIILTGLALAKARDFSRFIVAVLCVVAANLPSAYENTHLIDYYPRMVSAMLPLGEALAISEGTLVMGDAGLTPFASGWRLVDTNHLMTPLDYGQDSIIAMLCEPDREPTILALYASDSAIRQQDLPYAEAAERCGYEFITQVEWRNNYWYFVFANPSAKSDTNLVHNLEEAGRLSRRENGQPRWLDSVLSWFWYASR